ncbi:hypothetical protein [Pseudonocardia sp. TRM90224]|uniref:hypothetical protein n=1 Tax=Pseudonocardia sp. TRM90224 TaxID=2812678 RepID=UPI001E292820|nr:hypothetical protein [Pseudonocardia sp. TRM90224]
MSGLLKAVRWPLTAVTIAAGLIVLAFVLDTGPTTVRELALTIGAPTLFFLLPAAVIWLIVAAVLHARRD